MSKRKHKIKSMEKMEDATSEETSKINGDLLEKLAKSFTKRIDICIAVKSSSVKY